MDGPRPVSQKGLHPTSEVETFNNFGTNGTERVRPLRRALNEPVTMRKDVGDILVSR